MDGINGVQAKPLDGNACRHSISLCRYEEFRDRVRLRALPDLRLCVERVVWVAVFDGLLASDCLLRVLDLAGK